MDGLPITWAKAWFSSTTTKTWSAAGKPPVGIGVGVGVGPPTPFPWLTPPQPTTTTKNDNRRRIAALEPMDLSPHRNFRCGRVAGRGLERAPPQAEAYLPAI